MYLQKLHLAVANQVTHPKQPLRMRVSDEHLRWKAVTADVIAIRTWECECRVLLWGFALPSANSISA